MADQKVLSIGSVAGGPGSDRRWVAAAMALGREVRDAREAVSGPLAVNVVFHIPGAYLTPDFAGARVGRFSRKDSKLLVQVALPAVAPTDARSALLEFVCEAASLAEEFAVDRGLASADGLPSVRGLVDQLRTDGANPSA